MKVLAFVLALAACSNDAITYARLISPDADCSSHNLYNSGPDYAVCRFNGKVWWCTGPNKSGVRPSCEPIVDIPVEVK